MITTPLSRLADLLNVDISSMNRADAQDAVCRAAIIELAVMNGQIDNLAGTIASVMNDRDELRSFLLDHPAVEPTMKAGCIGVFEVTLENGNVCPECWQEHKGSDCEICNGQSDENGFSDLTIPIPWHTQKNIFKRMWAYKTAAFFEERAKRAPHASE